MAAASPSLGRQLARTENGHNSERQSPTKHVNVGDEEIWEYRHGWEDQYNSNEYLSNLTSVSPLLSLLRSITNTMIHTTGLLHVLHGQAPRNWREAKG